MFDLLRTDLDCSEDVFLPGGCFTTMEILADGNGSGSFYQQHDMPEERVKQWLQVSQHVKLRILFMNGRAAGRRPLPCSAETFALLEEKWRLPSFTLDSLTGSSASAVPFKFEGSDGIPTTFGINLRRPGPHYRMILVHDILTHCTNIVFLGLDAEGINTVERHIRGCVDFANNPMLIPLIMVEYRSLGLRGAINQLAKRLSTIQTATRGSSSDGDAESLQRYETKLTENAGDLTDISSAVTEIEFDFRSISRAVDVILPLGKYYADSSPQPLPASIRRTADLVESRLKYAIGGCQSALNELILLRKETKAVIDTAYTILNQKDNRLGYEAAQASLQIAKDTKKVALLARQDSTDMRIVASVTLIFLPATFMATLFDSSLFNFQSQTRHNLVSNWIWLYWVITAVLTVFVLLAWLYVSRLKNRQMHDIVDLEGSLEPSTLRLQLRAGKGATKRVAWPWMPGRRSK